jgi:hypothetical protein
MFRLFSYMVAGLTALACLPLFVPPVSVQAATNFNCGPHTLTYEVRSLSNNAFGGIRCVKKDNGYDAYVPSIAWYGEGKWGSCTYRHVGHAFYSSYSSPYTYNKGYASDIYGNGECANSNFNGNLTVSVKNDWTKIYVTGAWSEVWTKVSTVNYTPLNRPYRCGVTNGGYFDQYYVNDTLPVSQGGRYGAGLRCMLKIGRAATTWFGNGWWSSFSNQYSHLGTKGITQYTFSSYLTGYGASDLCGFNFGPVCSNFAYGSLKFSSRLPRGYFVTGSWRETWY